MLKELHNSRGSWIPRMVHRKVPSAEGVWGRWNDIADRHQTYGFTAVKGFWFTGLKTTPTEGKLDIARHSMTTE